MSWIVHHGDCLEILPTLPSASINCCVTSPPYFGLRDYGVDGQIGLESTPAEFVAKMVAVFREVRRVLRDDGTLWLNLGDSYAGAGYSNHVNTGGAQREQGGKQRHLLGTGLKPKDIVGVPWRVAFALQDDGWYLRQDIIWSKPNPMPESVTDRCTKSHEYLFLLAKSERYYFDQTAMKEPSVCRAGTAGSWDGNRDFGLPGGQVRFGKPNLGGSIDGTRNRRSVWTVATQPFAGDHFAAFPTALIDPCVRASCPPGGVVLDPFTGAGTTGLVAARNGCNFTGIELNAKYVEIARRRIAAEAAQGKLEFT